MSYGYFSKYDREVVRVFEIREHHAKIVKPGRYDQVDQSVHVQSYHSSCLSYTSDGKQDSCIRKIYKLSIMLASPAVRYAPAAVEIEPLRFLQVTGCVVGSRRVWGG